MKLFALTSLVVGSLIANQAFAGDISTQPLTREDCDKAAMAWDDNANVCGSESDKAEVRPKPSSIVLITIDKTKQQIRAL